MSWVRAMYWMRSMWCASLSSWSMLSLAARWRWNCLLFGEPGSRQTPGGERVEWVVRVCATAGRSEVTLNSGESFRQLLRFLRGFCELFLLPWYDRRTEPGRSVCVCRMKGIDREDLLRGSNWLGTAKFYVTEPSVLYACVCVYIRLLAGERHLTVGCWSPLLNRCLFTTREYCQKYT